MVIKVNLSIASDNNIDAIADKECESMDGAYLRDCYEEIFDACKAKGMTDDDATATALMNTYHYGVFNGVRIALESIAIPLEI